MLATCPIDLGASVIYNGRHERLFSVECIVDNNAAVRS